MYTFDNIINFKQDNLQKNILQKDILQKVSIKFISYGDNQLNIIFNQKLTFQQEIILLECLQN